MMGNLKDLMSMMNGEVLVVDDTAANLDVVSQVLEVAGYDVSTALDGESALKLANLHPPDLILLDVQMPGIDGFQTCQKLKFNPETEPIPIIFMTALDDTESKIRAFDLGAVDYITKPFQEKELLARVKAHVQLRQWNRTLESRVAQRTQELQTAIAQLNQSQLQLVQSEKMSALGNMIAGIAHEINNPLSFLHGSIHNGQDYLKDLLEHLALYQQHCGTSAIAIQDHAEEIDLEFLCEDFAMLLESMQGATHRIRNISDSLRTFSRTDKDHKVSFDLHDGLDSTLLILKHRLKANEQRPAIEIAREYGNLPEVQCFPGQLNQVFMNLIANAIDALDESSVGRSFTQIEANPPRIAIETKTEGKRVEIAIADNGKGMPEEVRGKIFEQGFTTKGVGDGTGLGLAIARQIVEDTHSGTLTCTSKPGENTTFIIKISSQA